MIRLVRGTIASFVLVEDEMPSFGTILVRQTIVVRQRFWIRACYSVSEIFSVLFSLSLDLSRSTPQFLCVGLYPYTKVNKLKEEKKLRD